MPCDSSYTEANQAEINSRDTASNLVYVMEALSLPCPSWIKKASDDYYGNADKLNDMVIILCDLCTKMSDEQREAVIYNSKNKKARKLADWWEEHQEADKERKERESFGNQIS